MDTISLIFKTLCVVTTVGMIGFWLYKYHQNEDATLIEYKPVDSTENTVYPESTFCVIDPFLNIKLNDVSSGLDK